MNLALITQDFPPETGGIETYSAELARRFSSKCSSFFVLAPDKPTAGEIDRILPYPVHRINTKNTFLGLKAIPQGLDLFEKHGISGAFHANWQTLPLSIFARKKGLLRTIYVSVHGRDLLYNPLYHYPLLKQGYEKYKRWMFSKVDLFFPVSSYMADLLRKHGVVDERIIIVPNGTNPKEFYPLATEDERKLLGINAQNILFSASRLVSKKGIDTTLKAFQKVLQHHPDSCYIIAGEGEQEGYLKKMVVELNIEKSTCFIGRIPHAKLIHYYNACDVFVMSSRTEGPDVEGFGIVFLEANACGKPVVGTRSGGIPSAIVDGQTGLLVEEENVESLANAINRLFSRPKLAAKMGGKGRRRVIEEANWDKTASDLLSYINNTI